MRKLVIAAVVAVAALATAAVALAVTTQHYKQTFTSKKTGKPAGTPFHADGIDPANTANNKQPASLKELDIILPKGSVINPKAVPACKASDNDFASKGVNACPSKSLIGHFKGGCQGSSSAEKACSGKATVRLRFGSDIHARVYAYAAKNNKLALYINATGAQPIILRPKVSLGSTPKIITKVPILCALGTPPNCGSAGEARLDSFDLTIDKIKKSGKVFITTPKTCPASKNWVFKAKWFYRPATSGEPPQPATESHTSNSPCV